jgi:hypothetical protein
MLVANKCDDDGDTYNRSHSSLDMAPRQLRSGGTYIVVTYIGSYLLVKQLHSMIRRRLV